MYVRIEQQKSESLLDIDIISVSRVPVWPCPLPC